MKTKKTKHPEGCKICNAIAKLIKRKEDEKLEQILIDCHQALLSLYPASYAWGDVNEWLVEFGKKPYSRKLKKS